MPKSYLKSKIKEALKATDNDKKDAQKLLITWAVRDQQLLLGLAKPHLRALAAAQIEEVTRIKGKKKKADKGPEKLDLSMIGEPKGEQRKAVKVPPPKSSKRQASVMTQIADAFKKKK